MREIEELVSRHVEEGLKDGDPRLKAQIIQKKGDPSKIYVLASTDHRASDGLSLLQCFSMMQDKPVENPLPFPKRPYFSNFELLCR